MTIRRLDTVRGVAILVVLVFHLLGAVYGQYRAPWNGLWVDVRATPVTFFLFCPVTIGLGVPLFFVLSGLVIHLSYLRRPGEFRFATFYWRRLWRIYPAYLAAVLFFMCWWHVDPRRPEGLRQLFTHLTAIHNLHPETVHGLNGSFWSLAAEVQFYLLYPLVLALRRRFGMTAVVQLSIVVSAAAQLGAATVTSWSWDAHIMGTVWHSTPILWCDWVFGAMLAECYHQGRRMFHVKTRSLALGLIGLLAMSAFRPTDLIRFSLASVWSAMAIEKYLWSPRAPRVFERALALIGTCSYSLYLWHQPLQSALVNSLNRVVGPLEPALKMLIELPLVLLVLLPLSWLSYLTLERWGVRFGAFLQKKWLIRRVSALATLR